MNLFLDSDNKDDSSTSTKLVWRINYGIIDKSAGSIATRKKPKLIYSAKLRNVNISNLSIDDFKTSHYLYNVGTPTFTIDEFPQAFISEFGLHHFPHSVYSIFGATLTTTGVQALPMNFNQPLNPPTTISLTLRDMPSGYVYSFPETPTSFPASQLITSEAYTWHTGQVVGSGYPIVLNSPYFHMLSLYYAEFVDGATVATSAATIVISGFTTDDPIADAAIIDQVNSTHTLYYISKTGTGTSTVGRFTIDVDLSTITAAVDIPINISFEQKPRLTAVLDLI